MYVKRGIDGEIVAVSHTEGDGFLEFQPQGHPELCAYLSREEQGREQLAATDLELIRVLEDLIDVLVYKDLIHFTDLPDAAQRKLLGRRNTRVKIREGLNLLDEDDERGLV